MWNTEIYRLLNTKAGYVVGSKTAKALESISVFTIYDLLHHLPHRYVKCSESSNLAELVVGETVAVKAKVVSVNLVSSYKSRLDVVLSDSTNFVTGVFFGPSWRLKFLSNQLRKSSSGLFVGKVGQFRDQLQLNNPNFVMLDDEGNVVGHSNQQASQMAFSVARKGTVGIYRSSAKIDTWDIAHCIQLALPFIADAPEDLPQSVLSQYQLPGLVEAFQLVHEPENLEDVARGARRLKFDQGLGLQIEFANRRQTEQSKTATPCPVKPGGLLAQLDSHLPFKLTDSQLEVGNQISNDLADSKPMRRLLQGDVGAGKTVVALRAMCQVVDNGCQAVLLAPTEVLANQHFATITKLLAGVSQNGSSSAGVEVILLTGSLPQSAKRSLMAKIVSGQGQIIVGTHELLSKREYFADLGLVVVDEQHRFGVEQRSKLTEGSECRPHELVMSATPIPRSVAMTVYGDLELSVLKQLPAQRAEVKTIVVNTLATPSWVKRIWERAAEEIAAGHQVFVVCPKISPADQSQDQEESTLTDSLDPYSPTDPSEPKLSKAEVASVYETFDHLTSCGPLAQHRLAVLHSKLSVEEKERVMADFASGNLDVLISTTVIEVGVDVPNATMMVILDADRFGISQLHQIRGRIGRSDLAGLCLLVTSAIPDSPAASRLNLVASSRDGFVLAEQDLIARREGNILGASQSGGSVLKWLNVLEDADLISQTKDLAQRLLVESGDQESVQGFIEDMRTQLNVLADDGSGQDWISRN